jgi:hypothetical protein
VHVKLSGVEPEGEVQGEHQSDVRAAELPDIDWKLEAGSWKLEAD